MKSVEYVKKLQIALNEQGESLVVDGDFGPKTESALAKFKLIIGLVRLETPQPVEDTEKDLGPAIRIIKEFEGLLLDAYVDPAGVPTIGYGTTVYPNGMKVKIGDRITLSEAEEYLIGDIRVKTASMNSLIKVPISNNAYCALVSFCYNLGVGALKKSALLEKLNASEPMHEVAKQFGLYVNALDPKTGLLKPLPGLIRRRNEEAKLFLS